MMNLFTGQLKYENAFTNEHVCEIFDKSAIAMIMINASGLILKANDIFAEMLGYTVLELEGRYTVEFTHPDDVQFSQSVLQRIALETAPLQVEKRYVHKNGNIIWGLVLGFLNGVYENEPYYVACIQDMTRFKQQEKELESKDSHNKYLETSFRQLIENWPDGFVIIQDYNIVYSNQAALKIINAARMEQIIGRPVFDFIAEDKHSMIREKISQVYEGSISKGVMDQLIRLDGRTIDVEFTAIPAHDNSERAMHLLFRDVTELKRTEDLMRVSDKLNAVGQLAAGIAHEIRNPLTAIKGFIKLAREKYPESPHYFDIIRTELERIELITNELLLLAKPGQSTMQVLDVRDILGQVSVLLETQGALNNVQISQSYTNEAPLLLHGDGNQLKQVFINILKNAIEAMPKGGEIQLEARMEQEEIRIDILDQGPGLTEEQLKRIGQPFYTTKATGTGLGLVVSYKIIQSHGGRIAVENRLELGARFTIHLPPAPAFLQ